jgi:hypothetical protein
MKLSTKDFKLSFSKTVTKLCMNRMTQTKRSFSALNAGWDLPMKSHSIRSVRASEVEKEERDWGVGLLTSNRKKVK